MIRVKKKPTVEFICGNQEFLKLLVVNNKNLHNIQNSLS